MPEIVSTSDRPWKQYSTKMGGSYRRMQLIDHPPEQLDAPEAFIIEGDPGRQLPTHFHDVDQFQIITSGTGTVGRHGLAPRGVHFARAYTPYGPIVSGNEGLGYLTLRARRDPLLAQYVPACRDKLKSIPDRAPWQHTAMPAFPVLRAGESQAVNAVPGLDDGSGLFVHAVTLAAGARMRAPDPSIGGGQFIVGLKGGLVQDGSLRDAIVVVFVANHEPAFELQAGPQGLEVLMFGFPRSRALAVPAKAAAVPVELKTWQCALCAFVYDEAAGLPEEGIVPGTRWADVPESWGCPDCSAMKADFEMVEI